MASFQVILGDVAQLEERHNGIVEVVGSSPIVSTSLRSVSFDWLRSEVGFDFSARSVFITGFMKPTLLVLAAGMGKRYGGLKQLDGVGPAGETLLEYSIFDAWRAGFDNVVVVIRPDFEDDFKEQVGSRLSGRLEVRVVHQEINSLPNGFKVPQGRTKPWGTGHAVLVARDLINGPFGVINADDFYGPETFTALAGFLGATGESEPPEFCLVGYRLGNTLSDFGSVSRGICTINDRGRLDGIVERTRIEKSPRGPHWFDECGEGHPLGEDVLVSMNIFGFTPALFEMLGERFKRFLEKHGGDSAAELYLPRAVSEMISLGQAQVEVLPTGETWFGITYAEEMQVVRAGIRKKIQTGQYPERLWS